MKTPRHQENSITLVFTFHPALNKVFNILKSAHCFIEKSLALKVVLPKPPRVASEKITRQVSKIQDQTK